jgi:hypothetical protein
MLQGDLLLFTLNIGFVYTQGQSLVYVYCYICYVSCLFCVDVSKLYAVLHLIKIPMNALYIETSYFAYAVQFWEFVL